MSCNCLGVLYKPRYKRQVDAIYPSNPMDEKLIRAEMVKLTYYTLHHPEKLDRIAKYLNNIFDCGLVKHQHGWVKVSIDAIVELLKPCHAQRINFFISSYLNMCMKLLESQQYSFKLLGTHAFVQFSEKEEEVAVQNHDYSKFIKIFCNLCQESSNMSREERRQIRKSGIQGLQGVLRKAMEQQQRDDLIKQYIKIIISALLFNMQSEIGKNSDIISVDSSDEQSPRGLADQVLRDLLSRVTISQINQVIKPLLEHLDRNNLWPTKHAVAWAQLFMKSVRESYSQIIVKLTLQYMRTKDFVNDNEDVEGILNVVSEICLIPDMHSLGSVAQELFVSISTSARSIRSGTSLCKQYIKTCGIITSNLQSFIQIEVTCYLLDEVCNTTDYVKRGVLLQIMAHCVTFFMPTKDNEQVVLQTIVQPLLEFSQEKIDIEAEEIMLIGRILISLLDHQHNLTALSRAKSWQDKKGLVLAKNTSIGLRRLSRNLIAWLYEKLKRKDNETTNFIVYYKLAAILLAEMTDRLTLAIELIKIFLALQDLCRIDDVFENSLKCQTHACIAASLSFISFFCEPIASYVIHVVNERKNSKPQIAPDSLFSGSSDALRRSTASLYYREDKEDIEKYFFSRQQICDNLRTAGVDITGLVDPVCSSELEIQKINTEIKRVESFDGIRDDVSFEFPFTNPNVKDVGLLSEKEKSLSFTDLLNSYKAVPQTMEDINKHNADSVMFFKKRQFEQIVTTIEEERSAQNEILSKLLLYTDHLQDSGVFVDQDEPLYPCLFSQ